MKTRALFVALFLTALFTMAVRETLDPDMWWHLRTGEYILQHGIPRLDTFSFTVPDHEWITHEWLSQVVMWVVYQVGGLPGLMLITAVLVTTTFGLLYAVTPGRPFLAAFVVLLAAVTSAIVWGARPQMFNLLLTAAFVFIVERFRAASQTWQTTGRNAPRVNRRALLGLWFLPVLTILWVNFHSGYLLGVVLLGTYTVGEAMQRWWRREGLTWLEIRQLGVVTAVSFVAAILNPNGIELWIYPFLTLGSGAMQAYILEWHSPDFHQPHFWPFVLMLAVGVLSWVFSQKRPTFSDLLILGGTAAAGLLSARHIPLFAIVSTPIIGRHLLSSLQGTPFYRLLSGETAEPVAPPFMRVLNGVILLLAVLAAGVWVLQKTAVNETAIAEQYPVAAIDFLEQQGLTEQRIYNSYNWGGYLIWRNIPVFVDGRADVYGDDFLFFYLQAYEGRETWVQPLDQFGAGYVLMEHTSVLSTILLTSPEWQEVYSDGIARIFARVTP